MLANAICHRRRRRCCHSFSLGVHHQDQPLLSLLVVRYSYSQSKWNTLSVTDRNNYEQKENSENGNHKAISRVKPSQCWYFVYVPFKRRKGQMNLDIMVELHSSNITAYFMRRVYYIPDLCFLFKRATNCMF